MVPYYEENGITIYYGNCLDVLPNLVPVDHVLTDPPFSRDVYIRMNALNIHAGSGTLGRLGLRPSGTVMSTLKPNGTSIAKMAAGDIGHVNDLVVAVSQGIAQTRRWVLIFSDAEFTYRWRDELEAAGLRYVRTGAWVKPDPMPQMSGDRPAVGFEPCTIAHAQGAMRWNGGGSAALWIHGTVKKNRPNHPCPKPEPLMRELVMLFTDEGETILDPFMGSGTTLFEAKRAGRKAIGIEIEEKYCQVAADRLRQEVLQFA